MMIIVKIMNMRVIMATKTIPTITKTTKLIIIYE